MRLYELQWGGGGIHTDTGAFEGVRVGWCFYHACLVFRSSSHGLTERQALKAGDRGRSTGVMFQLSFVEEEEELQ